MPPSKRPDKIKFSLVKTPSTMMFFDDLLRRDSIYVNALQSAMESDQCIEIMAEDKYLAHQLRKASEKIKVRLVFGREGDKLFVRPIRPSDQENRLIALLREQRTIAELEAVSPKLEMNIRETLARMARAATAHEVRGGKWVLTERGMDLLPKRGES